MVKKTSFSNELYLCEKCYRLYARFYVRIDYDEDKTYTTVYVCSKCEELLKSIREEEIPLIPCAKCGEESSRIPPEFAMGLNSDLWNVWYQPVVCPASTFIKVT